MTLGKKIRLALGGLLALVLVAAILAALFLNSLARQGIQAGATYALGVPTTLQRASIGIISGGVQLDGLHVANVPGFPSDHFLTLGQTRVAVNLPSLAGDTIFVPELTLADLDVRLERRDGTGNYDAILGNLQKLSGAAKDQPAPKPAAGKEKKLVIHELTIRNVRVHADMLGGGVGEIAKVEVPIAEIRLIDVGKTGRGVSGSGVSIGELSGLIIQAVLAAAVEKGGLPGELVGDLKNKLADLGDLAGEVGKQVVNQTQEAAQDLGKHAESLGSEVQKQADKLGDGLKGLIPKIGKDDKR